MGSNNNNNNNSSNNDPLAPKFDLIYTNSPLLTNLTHSSSSPSFIGPWNSLNDYYGSSPSLLSSSLSTSTSPRLLSSSTPSFSGTPTYFSPLSTPHLTPSSSLSSVPSTLGGRSKKKRGIQWERDQIEKDPRLLAAEQMKQRQLQIEKREQQIKEIRETLSAFKR